MEVSRILSDFEEYLHERKSSYVIQYLETIDVRSLVYGFTVARYTNIAAMWLSFVIEDILNGSLDKGEESLRKSYWDFVKIHDLH